MSKEQAQPASQQMPTMVSLGKQNKALAKDTAIYIGKTQYSGKGKVLGDSEACEALEN